MRGCADARNPRAGGTHRRRAATSRSRVAGRIGWCGLTGRGSEPALRFENGDFDRPDSVDTEARDTWYLQAIGSSPAMFRRDTKARSLYWLGHRDAEGAYLNGSHTYRLRVPFPVPAQLFWSVTVYDAQTRSQVQTDQRRAVLSSRFDFDDVGAADHIDLHFGPTAPADQALRWVQTTPDVGWFVYLRLYGPEEAALDGTWRPGDFIRT